MTVSKNITMGILAHVDAGKTTLTEAVLFKSGAIRSMGRVDNGDSHFDSHEQERRRGITIFSKQNPFDYGGKHFTLIDTPGHVDFSAEMERTLAVLDAAVVVIDGVSGIQGHTETVWHLLEDYGVPTFVFINKTDREQADKEKIKANLTEKFSGSFIDFSADNLLEITEEVSLLEDEWTEAFLEGNSDGAFWRHNTTQAISQRKLFPVICGSALKGDGVERLLETISLYSDYKTYPDEFSARVYKILHDSKGNRLTFMKISGGRLQVKGFAGGEKTEQLRIYSGEKSESIAEASAGDVCAAAGLYSSFAGQVIGSNGCLQDEKPRLSPMLVSSIILPESADIHSTVKKLRQIEEEMPELAVAAVTVNSVQEIQIKVMGRIQLEVLKELVAERFGIEIDFGPCRILYKETIASPVMGYGHYEPLRHYAETQLRIEPAPRGSGIEIACECSLETLDSNYRNLVLTHIGEKTHLGVLTGSPLTDVKIILTAGRAHLKHTEGGDFREATYRAIRQGLEKAQSILLEPYYNFVISVPQDCVGRAIADIQRMSGEFDPPETHGTNAVISGSGPVAEFIDYPEQVTAYTKGTGSVSFRDGGYKECHNPQTVIESIGYKKENDLENPSSSVFCSHGAGFEVKWQDVDEMRHIK